MEPKQRQPLKAIRAKCYDCCGGNQNEIRACGAINCPLYEFRFGKNPYRKKREISEEQKKEMLERLNKAKNKN